MRPKTLGWLLLSGLILLGQPSLAQMQQLQTAPAPAEKPAAPAPQSEKAITPSPDPLKILQTTCDFLKAQQQFSYKAEVADDEVYYQGKKLQYQIDMETWVRRPDRLRVLRTALPAGLSFYLISTQSLNS